MERNNMQGKRKILLRNDSYAFFLLKQFYYLSTMWKQDANLYLNSFGDEYTNYRNYKKLLDLGFIEEYKALTVKDIKPGVSKTELFQKLDKPGRSSYTVANITKSGINYLIDHSKENSYLYTYHKRFRTSNPDLYLKELYKSHVLIMMECAGAKVHPNEKPSLYHLYGVLSDSKNYDPAMDYSDRFAKYNFMKPNEIESIKANNGFFYSLDEFREFDKCINGAFNQELEEEIKKYYIKSGLNSCLNKYHRTSLEKENYLISEEYKSSKCAGIFISDKRCLMVYLSDPSTNKLIYISNAESILKSKINMYFSSIMNYSKYTILINGENNVSGIDGLVLSDGNSMIYSMATGKKAGHFRQQDGKDLAKLYTPHSLLLHNNDLFANIYVTPSTKTGIRSLHYLLTHSVIDYEQDCYKQVKEHPDLFTCTEERGDFFSYGYAKENDGRYINLPRPVVFMPVAEVNTLFQLSFRSSDTSDYYDRYAFITYPELVNAISHSIRKDECLYYDADDTIIYTKQVTNHDGNIIQEDVSVKKRLYWNSDRNKYQGFANDEMQAIEKICLQNELNISVACWTIPQLEAYMYLFYNHQKINLSELCSMYYNNNDTKFHKPDKITEYNYQGFKNNTEILLGKKKKKKNKIYNLTLHSSDKDKLSLIKSAARAKHLTISKYALEIIYKQAEIDIEESNKNTKESMAAFRDRYRK